MQGHERGLPLRVAMMFVAPARTETPICREHIDLPEKKALLESRRPGVVSLCSGVHYPPGGCEHFETNTWQFLFWSGERLHRALDSTHRMDSNGF